MKTRFFINETSETDDDSALGTGETTDDAVAVSPAEAENTDGESAGQGPIPYSRFKEVNDQLRELKPFAELASDGYDADSLRNLVELDSAFAQDPFGTTASIVDTLDLPTEKKELLKKALTEDSPAVARGKKDDEQEDEEMPQWARELQQRLDDHDKAAEDAELSQTVEKMLSQWRKLDEEADLKPLSEKTMLTHIISASQREGDPDDILRVAREEYDEMQSEALTRTLKPGERRRSAPVPSGGSAVTNSDEPPKTLAEASAQARKYLEEHGSEE